MDERQRKYITRRFEDVLRDTRGLAERLRREDPAYYGEWVDTGLHEHADYPAHANRRNVTHHAFLSSSPALTPERWADMFIEARGIKSEGAYELYKDDIDKYEAFIMEKAGDGQSVVMTLVIPADFMEWLDENPDIDTIAREIEIRYDNDVMRSLIPDHAPDYKARIRQQLKDDGWTVEPDLDDLLIDITDTRLTLPFDTLAVLREDDFKAAGSLKGRLNRAFFEETVSAGHVDYDIEILSDERDFL